MHDAFFSPWMHWDERLQYPERGSAGVYLLARFDDAAPDVVDSCDERILLVAETHNQSLQQRWRQFSYSAFKGSDGHAGGLTYYRLFTNGTDTEAPAWLYVAASPASAASVDVKAHTIALKSELLASYTDRYGIPPCCNAKKPSDGAIREVTAPLNLERDAPSAPEEEIEPAIRFSSWKRWVDRGSLDACEHAGIYALARFEGDAPATVDVFDERVIYLGETCSNSLAGRLWQFNRSAFLGKDGHSGGWSYRSRCSDNDQHLFVAMLPVKSLTEPRRSAFIRYVERELLWKFVKRWGRRPLCNSK